MNHEESAPAIGAVPSSGRNGYIEQAAEQYAEVRKRFILRHDDLFAAGFGNVCMPFKIGYQFVRKVFEQLEAAQRTGA
jgi:hypothetical protein